MNRVALALMTALFGFSAHAAVEEVALQKVFRNLAGQWAGNSVFLTYVVNEEGVRLEGQSCRNDVAVATAEDCRTIDEDYFIDNARLLHDYPNFGVKPVEIVEMTDTKIVRTEQNPVMANRSQIITEEVINEGQTLHLVVEQVVNGRPDPRRRHEFMLDRVN